MSIEGEYLFQKVNDEMGIILWCFILITQKITFYLICYKTYIHILQIFSLIFVNVHEDIFFYKIVLTSFEDRLYILLYLAFSTK